MFRCFTADALSEPAEAEVIERWLGHMQEVKRASASSARRGCSTVVRLGAVALGQLELIPS